MLIPAFISIASQACIRTVTTTIEFGLEARPTSSYVTVRETRGLINKRSDAFRIALIAIIDVRGSM